MPLKRQRDALVIKRSTRRDERKRLQTLEEQQRVARNRELTARPPLGAITQRMVRNLHPTVPVFTEKQLVKPRQIKTGPRPRVPITRRQRREDLTRKVLDVACKQRPDPVKAGGSGRNPFRKPFIPWCKT